ncbi:hypothetical protein GCM10029963_52800 [Micromonospora andamanensis]
MSRWSASTSCAAPSRPPDRRRRSRPCGDPSLDRAGLGAHLDEISALFFARRFALTRPFADALPARAALRPRWTLGFATSGNSHAERCGLAGEFTFEVYAHREEYRRNLTRTSTRRCVAAAGVDPAQVVLVGDNLAHDVVGAQQVGLRAVWPNRRGGQLPAGVVLDAVVSTHAELPTALAALSGEADLQARIRRHSGETSRVDV